MLQQLDTETSCCGQPLWLGDMKSCNLTWDLSAKAVHCMCTMHLSVATRGIKFLLQIDFSGLSRRSRMRHSLHLQHAACCATRLDSLCLVPYEAMPAHWPLPRRAWSKWEPMDTLYCFRGLLASYVVNRYLLEPIYEAIPYESSLAPKKER